jgi:uncharacterized protein
MILHVQELLSRQHPVELNGSFDVAELFRETRDVIPLGPLAYRLTAQASDRTIIVAGELTCTMRLLCARCLAPMDESFVLPFEEHFRVVGKEDGLPADEDADDVTITGERIDLRPYLEEELVVHLPLAPICSEQCKGLCPTCGANLNEQPCACKHERIDPRLEALQNWFKTEE